MITRPIVTPARINYGLQMRSGPAHPVTDHRPRRWFRQLNWPRGQCTHTNDKEMWSCKWLKIVWAIAITAQHTLHEGSSLPLLAILCKRGFFFSENWVCFQIPRLLPKKDSMDWITQHRMRDFRLPKNNFALMCKYIWNMFLSFMWSVCTEMETFFDLPSVVSWQCGNVYT